MSRMTKFLKQKANYQSMKLNEDGEPVLDIYGDPTYKDPEVVPCRRERSIQDIVTTTGALAKSSTIYYFDERVVVVLGDLVDGNQILDFEEYVNEDGKTEGYMVVV